MASGRKASDIKPENFLIVTLPNLKYNNPFLQPDPKNLVHTITQIILSDFGISRHFTSITQAITNSTQPEKNFFSAPEVLCDGSPHDIKSDIFSLGCIMLEILAVMRNVPSLVENTKIWGSGTAYGSKASVQNFTVASSSADHAWLQDLDEQEQKYFHGVLEIIEKLLRHDPDKRPSATEIRFSFQDLVVKLKRRNYLEDEIRRAGNFEDFSIKNRWSVTPEMIAKVLKHSEYQEDTKRALLVSLISYNSS
ncbi:hypothetical protein ACMFMG_008345 [Clarireedia jacksonii]